jgi:hypothetical protein
MCADGPVVNTQCSLEDRRTAKADATNFGSEQPTTPKHLFGGY